MARSLQWIKLQVAMLNDPKMYRITDRLWRRAVECFMLAGLMADKGRLPSLDDMAHYLRVDRETLEAELVDLQHQAILDSRNGRWVVCNFEKWQGGAPGTIRWRNWRDRQNLAKPTSQQGANEVPTGEKRREESELESEREKRRSSRPRRGGLGGREAAATTTIPCAICGGVGVHVATIDADGEVDTCPVGLGMSQIEAVARHGRMKNP